MKPYQFLLLIYFFGAWLFIQDVCADSLINTNQPLLFEAVETGNLESVRSRIAAGDSATLLNQHGYSALHWAILKDQLPIVRFLVEEVGADLRLRANNYDASSPLHLATFAGNIKLMKYLVEKNGASVHVSDSFGRTPLHTAVSGISLEPLKYLVKSGANIDATDRFLDTPLHKAAASRNLAAVKYLVKMGAVLVDSENVDKYTPLHAAVGVKLRGGLVLVAEPDNPSILSYLFRKGARLNGREAERGNTPLHTAAFNNLHDCVTFLVQNDGVDINSRNNYGETPLHLAANSSSTNAGYNEVRLVKYLVDNGADLNAVDGRGRRPVELARDGSTTKSFLLSLEN